MDFRHQNLFSQLASLSECYRVIRHS
jgi:hypothetical protein